MTVLRRYCRLPLLLGLYLLAIVAFIAATRWATLLAEHPAYPLTLVVVAIVALGMILGTILRVRRG